MNTNTKHWASITAGILSLAGYASAANLGSEKYTYDTSGNIVEKSIDGQVTQMTYDSSNRLTGRQAIGQSKETTAYDAAGRPIAMKDGTAQATRGMSYGYGDKVLENKNHDTNTGFFYNAEGQLVGKKTDSAVATYTWDGNVLAADDAQPFTNEAHISGGIPVLVAGEEIVTTDYLGSTLASGDKNFTSTAYGEGLEGVRFTGKPFIKELGNYVFHHRLYSPETNRWTVADPTGFPDGVNNYSYVNGNPIAIIDPQGTEEVTLMTEKAKVEVKSKKVTGQAEISGTIEFKYTYSHTVKPKYVDASAKMWSGDDSSGSSGLLPPPLPQPGGSGIWSLEEVNITGVEAPTPVAGAPNYLEWKDNKITKAFAMYQVGIGGTNIPCSNENGKFTTPAWEK